MSSRSLWRDLIGFLAPALVLGTPTARAADDEPALPPAATRKVDFARDIRPILERSCYECHGPKAQKSGLRLDIKRNALAGGDSGAAFEPGKSDESLLIEYVAAVDPDAVMPPKGKGKPLTAEEVGLLRAWIDQGASWPDRLDGQAAARAGGDHWSFQPIRHPAAPRVKNERWVRNPVDAFVLAKLEAMGIEPSPEADRSTLIRRLSLDLLGLPPTPEEVDRLLKDDAPDAYEQLVDRLLASPHFGERWGRHWLDLARYADSDGYEKDSPRPFAWRYRDWVIDAINRDVPFDQFTTEQLAGDLLPNATIAQKTATGFHRNTLTNREGGVDKEEFRVAAVFDRVSTTGTVWLGLTIGCAQCHTHKYDPILNREYYGMFAFFNNGEEMDIPAPIPGELEAYEKARATHAAKQKELEAALAADDHEQRPLRQTKWEVKQELPKTRWTVLEPVSVQSSGGATLKKQADGSILVSGKKPDEDVYTVMVETDLTGITALRLEALDDKSLPSSGPGRSRSGNFVLSELKASAEAKDHHDGGESRPVALTAASADYSQSDYPVAAAIDGNPAGGWAISPKSGQRHVAVFETKEEIGFAGGTRLTFVLEQNYGDEHMLGRFRLSATTSPRPVGASPLPDEIVAILALCEDDRTDAQKDQLAAYHRTVDSTYLKLAKAVADHARNAPKKPDSKLQTIAANPKPRESHILIRGDFLRPGDRVEPHTLSVLHSFEAASETPTRLDLAHWLLDPANPLTARVTINRTWLHLFGRGLVASIDDFGTRGEKPSHPDLLDWLAGEFMARGWSQKEMIKLIACSATYRQSSRHRPDLAERDPNNVWLARQSRLRLEAEVMRDVCLASSGLLVPRIGGPSVRPPQPAGIADLTYAGSAKWVDSQGPDRYRRGMYTWFQRTSPYPMLMTFDAPDSNVCCVRRERSNTPLQALTLLNDTVFVECAQALGRRIQEDLCCATTAERLRYAFKLALARDPSAEEFEVLARSYDTLLSQCKAHPQEAARLLGPKKHAEGDDLAESAAWVALGRTLLNLDEFVTRE